MNDDIREKLLPKKKRANKPVTGLHTGSTLLNLACSGKPNWGFATGSYYFFVGDSSSGKTFLTLTSLAEACKNSAFDNYQLIFDNAENGAMMNFRKFFGKKMAERIKAPSYDGEDPKYSHTVEEFYYNVDNVLAKGPAIYLLDSMDALTTDDEEEKFEAKKKAAAKGKDISGSYGTSKAKLNSSNMRVVFNKLRETDSILLVISQTRDNIGFGAQFNPKTRGGGHALTFYAALELWSSVAGHIKKKIKDKSREQGILCKVRVKKNRLTGRDRSIIFPIYHSFGIDDIGGCINWLVEEGHWTGTEANVTAPEFEFKGSKETLVTQIEESGQEEKLIDLVTEVWQDIEESCEVQRKKRYE